jgi:hypothetical protein
MSTTHVIHFCPRRYGSTLLPAHPIDYSRCHTLERFLYTINRHDIQAHFIFLHWPSLHRPSFISHDFTHTFPRTIIIDIIRVLGSDFCHQFAIPAESQVANRDVFKKFWPPNTVVPIFEELLDGRGIALTGNDNTVYSWTWIDLKDGPVVLEAPPKVLGTANDMWQRLVVDVGVTGPDKGRGGKYDIYS